MEDMDKTISAICNWIQDGLKQMGSMGDSIVLPEMTKALAELVSAKALAEQAANH